MPDIVQMMTEATECLRLAVAAALASMAGVMVAPHHLRCMVEAMSTTLVAGVMGPGGVARHR